MRISRVALLSLLATFAVHGQEPDQRRVKCVVPRGLLSQLDWPGVVKSVIPAYPAVAAARRVHGSVRVDVDIDSQGTVRAARVISGDEFLRESAQKAALRWTFRATEAGPHSISLTFVFGEVTYVVPKDQAQCGTSLYRVDVLWSGIAVTSGAT